MRFDAQLTAGTAGYCRYGYAKVLICRPFSPSGRPFPTTFWLTCPYLIHRAGMIESHGGVHELENYMSGRNLNHEWRKYNLIHQIVRLELLTSNQKKIIRKYHNHIFRRVINSGIGGIRYTDKITVKCLHLQIASYIALGYHPAEEWLKDKKLCGECKTCMC